MQQTQKNLVYDPLAILNTQGLVDQISHNCCLSVLLSLSESILNGKLHDLMHIALCVICVLLLLLFSI